MRDWIQEILTNCLGYYTFAFGKLKVGIRVNSSEKNGPLLRRRIPSKLSEGGDPSAGRPYTPQKRERASTGKSLTPEGRNFP